MAPAPDRAQDRLDSWKAIAEYLDRDVATVRRWEKSAGLPVRRVAGRPGRSVFAYRDEIDGWLRAQDALATPPPEVAQSAAQLDAHAPESLPVPRRWNWKVAAVAVAAGMGAIAWQGGGAGADVSNVRVEMTPAAVLARDGEGAERWRYPFPDGEHVVFPDWHDRVSSNAFDNGRTFIGATSFHTEATGTVTGGRVFELSPAGHARRTFAFDDHVTFTETAYSPPWAITDYRERDLNGARTLAVAAHHIHWWPSVVTILNDRWERTGTFVNAGWVERLHWLSDNRLMVVGFSNARDGGMVALLDPAAMTGQSPRVDDARYACLSCGPESALRYIVLPRSELNRVTGAPFNRAQLEPTGERIVLRTIEVPKDAYPADALYEFSASLDLLSASYGDRYWELHRSLESQGKLDHSRERCPERDGPRAVEVWQPDTRWKTIVVRP